jgi:cytochrome c oxidase accessory protein FixG
MSNSIPPHDDSPDSAKAADTQVVSLYAKRNKIQVRSISGFFQRIRIITIWIALGLFVLMPWVTWEGRQALLFDLPARKFYVFGWTFLPQDFFFLSLLLIIAAFGLFTATVFMGRLFCGYACPQTVWTKIFMMIEDFVEGDRNARIRMDKARMSLNKLLRRGTKHIAWLAVGFVTGITFVSYFSSARELTHDLLNFSTGPWATFWIGFFTLATYLNAGWMREQVCLHMCPYGRFQSVMVDKNTLIISYDPHRGEPRGNRRRDADYQAEGLGECIDCELCVRVCPTGIDIRKGLQYECVQCAACIDACDSIMDQMNYPRGLVRYTTENLLENRGKYRLLSPRLIGYATALGLIISVFLVMLSTRIPLEVEAIRDRNVLYRENSAGQIENVYMLKVLNKTQEAADYTVTLKCDDAIHFPAPVTLSAAPGELVSLPVTLVAAPDKLNKPEYDVTFIVHDTHHPDVYKDRESRFLVPTAR